MIWYLMASDEERRKYEEMALKTEIEPGLKDVIARIEGTSPPLSLSRAAKPAGDPRRTRKPAKPEGSAQ